MARISEEFPLLINAAEMNLENTNLPFFTKRVDSIELSKLPIGKAVRKWENLLKDYLVSFANTIENTPQTHESMLQLAKDLDDTLWLDTYQIYWLAVIYVATFAEVKPKITERDRDNVKEIVQKMSTSIWKRVDKFFVREKTIEDEKTAEALSKLLKEESRPRALKAIFNPKTHEPLNLDKQFKGLATVTATSALNIGTIDKARQILEGISDGSIISRNTNFARSKIAKASGEEDLLHFGPGLFQSLNWVMFVTAEDDRVCLICRELQGEMFLLTDPTLIIPVRDTHENCRCRLLLVDPIFDEENQVQNKVFAA